jgi:ketosteroid isomerase-like protein
MLARIGLCLLAILSIAMSAAAQDKLQDTLVAQERKLIDAINRKDTAAISELLADEAMSITSRGKQTTKEIIKSLETLSFSKHQISEPKAISVSPDVGILTYKFSWTGGVTGQAPATTAVYATSVWRQRDGKWRSVFYQETPIGAR